MNGLIEELDRACPGYEPDEYGVDLQYLWVSGYVRYLIQMHAEGRRNVVQAAFDVIENEIAADGPHAELAIVGFLEGMQNTNLHQTGTTPAEFRGYLRPHSLKAWAQLHVFWTGSELD